jgi:hypothetical protein
MSAKPRDLLELDWRKVERTVLRTAATISEAIDRMIADLPEYAAPHMARVRLVRELTRLQPTTMQQIMDHHYTREAYEALRRFPRRRAGRTSKPKWPPRSPPSGPIPMSRL